MRRSIVALFLLTLCVLPAFAQEDDQLHTITYDGFQFQYAESLAPNLTIRHYPGDSAEGYTGGAPVPELPHTQFLLYTGETTTATMDALPGVEGTVGIIRVYRTADFPAYPIQLERLEQLQSLIEARFDPAFFYNAGGQEYELPLLPAYWAGQTVRARINFAQRDTIAGISYLVNLQASGQASPFESASFWYTFQGLSTDGNFYISAVFPLTTTLFPADLPDNYFQANNIDLENYWAASVAQLNGASPDDFTPSLTALDELVTTFVVQDARP